MTFVGIRLSWERPQHYNSCGDTETLHYHPLSHLHRETWGVDNTQIDAWTSGRRTSLKPPITTYTSETVVHHHPYIPCTFAHNIQERHLGLEIVEVLEAPVFPIKMGQAWEVLDVLFHIPCWMCCNKRNSMKFVTRATQLIHLTHFHSCQTAPQIRHELVSTRCMSSLTTWTQIEDLWKTETLPVPWTVFSLCSQIKTITTLPLQPALHPLCPLSDYEGMK